MSSSVTTPTIINYKLVHTNEYSQNTDYLSQCHEQKINEMIKQGWYPLGGISVTTVQSSYFLYTQAMVKYK